ncbi:unnamed protein product [Paramecium primaurelia]|uniref:Uncharacterized protein n=1 Tax=Paramecium primaurelia TaxID=5886 RepID=A0A8S1JVU3_PARPR|nr:unnamed protein product [Paramecium primaurelia]
MTKLLSSQFSLPTILKSPQIGIHYYVQEINQNPFQHFQHLPSMQTSQNSEQLITQESHKSNGLKLPSSHSSCPQTIILSPQIDSQLLPVKYHPFYQSHSKHIPKQQLVQCSQHQNQHSKQPSYGQLFPSSQASIPITIQSPQLVVHQQIDSIKMQLSLHSQHLPLQQLEHSSQHQNQH